MKKYLMGAVLVCIPSISQGWFYQPPLPVISERVSTSSKGLFCHFYHLPTPEVVLSPECAQQVADTITAIKKAAQEDAPFTHVRINGAPGTGKSILAKHIAQKLGFDYVTFSTESLAFQSTEEALLHASHLFEFARTHHNKVAIIIEDSIDTSFANGLFRARDSKTSEDNALLLNYFLKQLSAEQHNFVVIAVTGTWQPVDQEMMKYLKTPITLGMPDVAERRTLFVLEVQKAFENLNKVLRTRQLPFFQLIFGCSDNKQIETPTNELSDQDFDELAHASKDLSGKNIFHTVHRAFLEALQKPQIKITKKLILAALEEQHHDYEGFTSLCRA